MARTVKPKNDAAARADATTKKPISGSSKMPRPVQGGKMPSAMAVQAKHAAAAAKKEKKAAKIDRLNEKPDGKKKRRVSAEVRAIREIKKYQKSFNPLLKRAPTMRIIKEIGHTMSSIEGLRWTVGAIDALREATEHAVVELLGEAHRAVLYNGQRTLIPKAMHFTIESYKNQHIPWIYSGPRKSEYFSLGGGRTLKQLRGTAQQKEYAIQRSELLAAKKADRAAKAIAKAAAKKKEADAAAKQAAKAAKAAPPADNDEEAEPEAEANDDDEASPVAADGEEFEGDD